MRTRCAARANSAAGEGADLILFPELFIAGYPPEDLVLKPAFQAACRAAVEALARETADNGPAVIVGTPWIESGKLYNAIALLDGGRITALRFKVDLPNYGVFDEKRVFTPGPLPGPVSFRGVRLGVPICEDIWGPEPVECIAETGGEILLVPNGSPYRRNVMDERLNAAVARVKESGLPLIYVNQVGGQDELVFEGASFILNSDASLAAQLPAFTESVALTHWERGAVRMALHQSADDQARRGRQGRLRDLRARACATMSRRTVSRAWCSGCRAASIPRSCAAIGVDALGAERVRAVMLPYKFTSQESLADAAAVAKALGIRYDIAPIESAVLGLEKALAPMFDNLPRDVTEENLQARARGTILMGMSNKFGLMVVTTGNKSEMSVGYATLYGDMNGGFNPIKDLYKTEVFRISALRNEWKPEGALGPSGRVIPDNVITKPPTAELRENQKDQDSLPPYDMLDAILERLVEREEPVAKIVEAGFDRDTVMRVDRMLNLAEYKRRQAAPGVKVTLRNFGRDRRYPITNRFRDPGTSLPKPDASIVQRIAGQERSVRFLNAVANPAI